MIFKGFRFGLLLQFAVGPMCLMVFNASADKGFPSGLYLMLAIALVDALYIALSCAGVASILNKNRARTLIKLLGCMVLVLFGANIIAGVFDISILPNITLFSKVSGKTVFVQGLLLTASNPLTIVFWSGVFSTQVIKNGWIKKQILFFALGCVLSTVAFLSLVALLGSFMGEFLPQVIMQVLNAAVGVLLIFFGLRLLIKKEEKQAEEAIGYQ